MGDNNTISDQELDRLLSRDIGRVAGGPRITLPEDPPKDNWRAKFATWLKNPRVWVPLVVVAALVIIVAIAVTQAQEKKPEKPKYDPKTTTITVTDPLAGLKGKKSTKTTVVVTEPQCPDVSRIRHFGFIHPKAVERYFDVEKEFGRPSHEARGPNGLLLWNSSTLRKRGHFYSQIVLRDEEVYHDKPAPHCDFLYASIPYMVPNNKIQDVLALSESVSYDALKRELTARCHFMGANVATLLLATKIATGELTLGEVIEADAYKRQITETMPMDPKNAEHIAKASRKYKEMTEELRNRVQRRAPLSARKVDDKGKCAAFKEEGC